MLRAAPAIRTGGRIAQLVEQLTLNQRVQGSSSLWPPTFGMYTTNPGLAARRERSISLGAYRVFEQVRSQ